MTAILAATRAIHYAAALVVFGEIVFALVVARPAWRGERAGIAWEALGERIRVLLLWSLSVGVVSGVAWLALEVPLMSGEPMEEAIAGPTLGVVLGDTWFGRVWSVRTVLALALFAWLLARNRRSWLSPWALIAAGVYVAAPALSGHAAGGRGLEGASRVAADMLHLAAAGAWVGALPGLVLLLLAARRSGDAAALDVAARTTRRFSVLGIVSVSILVASGIANSVYLVGSIAALTDTEYGELLLAKLAFAAAMIALAAVNLLRVSPRVAARQPRAVGSLARNAMLEIAGGAAVIAIVGALGITVPGEHAGHPMHPADPMLHSGTSGAIIPHSSPRGPHG